MQTITNWKYNKAEITYSTFRRPLFFCTYIASLQGSGIYCTGLMRIEMGPSGGCGDAGQTVRRGEKRLHGECLSRVHSCHENGVTKLGRRVGSDWVLLSFLKGKIKRLDESIDPRRCRCSSSLSLSCYFPDVKKIHSHQLHTLRPPSYIACIWTRHIRNDWLKPLHLNFLKNDPGSRVSRVILSPRYLIGESLGAEVGLRWHPSKSPRLLWNPTCGRHDIRAAWHQFEPLVSGGKNYEPLHSQVIVSNESVAHRRAFFSQGLNADCLDRLNLRVITKLSHRFVFQPEHTALSLC